MRREGGAGPGRAAGDHERVANHHPSDMKTHERTRTNNDRGVCMKSTIIREVLNLARNFKDRGHGSHEVRPSGSPAEPVRSSDWSAFTFS